jgi:hypothetical protein
MATLFVCVRSPLLSSGWNLGGVGGLEILRTLIVPANQASGEKKSLNQAIAWYEYRMVVTTDAATNKELVGDCANLAVDLQGRGEVEVDMVWKVRERRLGTYIYLYGVIYHTCSVLR